jgi:hypothetical protein
LLSRQLVVDLACNPSINRYRAVSAPKDPGTCMFGALLVGGWIGQASRYCVGVLANFFATFIPTLSTSTDPTNRLRYSAYRVQHTKFIVISSS